MLCGLDELSSEAHAAALSRVRGASFGLLTHAAAVDRRGRSALTVLEELGAVPTVLFTPEHGLMGAAQAMAPVHGADAGAPMSLRTVSLYGDTRASLQPAAADLEGLGLLVIDLCDVGSRYYTYVWTALLAARAAAAAGIHTLLLDRPNPISGDPATLEGRPQEREFCSFVGLEPLPIRHALTPGEIVAKFIETDGHTLGPSGALSVVRTRGWERLRTAQHWGRPFVMPSPNMPTVETALVYPGGCLLEGTNLSEGRGTTAPFQIVGAPFLSGYALARALEEHGVAGAQIRPIGFQPTFDKHAGQACQGVMVHVTHPGLFRPVATYLALIALAQKMSPNDFVFRREVYEFEAEIPAFDLLTGSAVARQAIEAGAAVDDVIAAIAPVPPGSVEPVEDAETRLERARA